MANPADTQALSRRQALTATAAALAGATAVNVVAIVATRAAEPDPIFAAIERHRAAHMHAMACSRVRAETVDVSWSPEYDPVKVADASEADRAARERDADAAMELLNVEPTTAAGMVALLEYVLDYNAGGLKLPDDPEWYSIPMDWPCDFVDQDEIDIGEEAGAPFAWALLDNVREFLARLS
jgi:hypothetical protein